MIKIWKFVNFGTGNSCHLVGDMKKEHGNFLSRPTSFWSRPSKHFLFSKTSWRRLQGNTFRLPRRHQDVFAIRLPKTSSRPLQDVFQDVFKTCSRRVSKTSCNYVIKTSSRRLQDVFSTSTLSQMFAGELYRYIYIVIFGKNLSKYPQSHIVSQEDLQHKILNWSPIRPSCPYVQVGQEKGVRNYENCL